jgi:hypothetical protein
MLFSLADASTKVETNDGPCYLFDIDPSTFRAVVMGARIRETHREEITSIIRHDPRYRHVVLLRSQLEAKEFALSFQSVPLFTPGELHALLQGRFPADTVDTEPDRQALSYDLARFGYTRLEYVESFIASDDEPVRREVEALISEIVSAVPEVGRRMPSSELTSWAASQPRLTQVGIVRAMLEREHGQEWIEYRLERNGLEPTEVEMPNVEVTEDQRDQLVSALSMFIKDATGLTPEQLNELAKAERPTDDGGDTS